MIKTFGYQDQFITVEQLSAISLQINAAIFSIGVRESKPQFLHGPNNSMGTLLSSFMEMCLSVIDEHKQCGVPTGDDPTGYEKMPSSEYNMM